MSALLAVALPAALTTPTDAPAVGTTVSDIASAVSNGLVDGFGSTIVYVVPTVIIFTAAAWAFGMLRTKRKPS
jgi:hypothetical protein